MINHEAREEFKKRLEHFLKSSEESLRRYVYLEASKTRAHWPRLEVVLRAHVKRYAVCEIVTCLHFPCFSLLAACSYRTAYRYGCFSRLGAAFKL